MLATMAELRGGLDGLRATHTFERVELEVGCGDGGFLDFLAGANPTTLYLGFEKDLVWAGKAARRVAGLPNARVWCADIRAVFEGIAGLGRAQALWMNCPDPWPKDRHAARRLSAEDYVDWLARILLQGGHFHLATDVESYHRELTELFQARANHWNLLTPAPRAAISYRTKFETRWRAEGRTMYHLGAELADPVPTDALARYDNAQTRPGTCTRYTGGAHHSATRQTQRPDCSSRPHRTAGTHCGPAGAGCTWLELDQSAGLAAAARRRRLSV